MAVSLVSTGVQFPDNSIQTTAAAASGTTTGTASGSISAGAPVIVNSSGSFVAVSGLAPINGAPVNAATTSSGKGSCSSATDPATGASLMLWGNGSPGYGYGFTATLAGVVTVGSAVPFTGSTSDNSQQPIVVAIGSNKFLISYWIFPGYTGYVSVATISGTTVSFGSPVAFGTSSDQAPMVYNSNNGTVFLTYGSGTGRVVSISGTTPSLGAAASIGSGTLCQLSYDSAANKVLAVYQDFPGGGMSLRANVITMSGTTFSVGATATLDVSQPGSITAGVIWGVGYNISTNVHVITYNGYSSGLGGYQLALTSGTISGTTFTFNPRILNPNWAGGGYDRVVYPRYCSDGSAIFQVGSAATGNYLAWQQVTVTSGGNTLGPIVIVNSTYAQGMIGSCDWNPIQKKFMRHAYGPAGANLAAAIAFNPSFTNATTNNFLGLSAGSYTNGQTATVSIVGGTNTGVSGLTPGLKYYLNYDGTLSNAPNNPANLYAGLATGAAKIIVKG